MRKSQIIIGIIFLLMIGLFITNWYYGEKAADVVGKEIKRIKAEKTIYIDYEDILVNPLRQMITIEDLVLYDQFENIKYRFGELEINLSLEDGKRFLKGEKLSDFESLILSGKRMVVQAADESQGKVNIGSFSVEYDGYISEEILTYEPKLILDYSQHLKIDIEDIKLTPTKVNYGLSQEELEDLFKLHNLSFKIDYNSYNQKLIIDQFDLASPYWKMNGSADYKLGKDYKDQIIPEKMLARMRLSLAKDIKFGDKELFGLYRLDTFEVNSNLELLWDESLPEKVRIVDGSTRIDLKGFKAQFEGYTKHYLENTAVGQITGMRMDEIAIDEFSFSTDMSNYSYRFDSRLLSPLLTMKLNADLEKNGLNDPDPIFRDTKITIKDMSEEVNKGIGYLEFMMGTTLPRQKEDIVIEVSGNLSNPRIKGLDF